MNNKELLKIVFYNRNIDDYEFIHINDYDKDKFPIGTYVPIGIEVINNENTDDGTSRILSLVNMSQIMPEYGTILDEEIPFGFEFVDDFGMEYNLNVPTIDENNNFFYWFNIVRDYYNLYFPSSNFVRKYSDNSMRSGAYIVPSPSSNLFSQKYEFGNILEKINGKEWTDKIIEIANRDKIIANAVQTTFRFNPLGEHYGDWYIPSIAEWCYVLDKLYEINLTLKLLIKKQPLYEQSIALIKNCEYWTSTLINEEYASVIHIGCGQILLKNKYEEALIRSMIKI